MKRRIAFMENLHKEKNAGSAIILVIIALAFVGILGVSLMWMTLAGYRMKATDRQTKESFYSAETVFEQIVAGLQVEVSDAVAKSYNEVLQNYSNWDESKRKSKFQTRCIYYIKESVASATDSGKYDLNYLMKYVDTAIGVAYGEPANLNSTHMVRRVISFQTAPNSGSFTNVGNIAVPVNGNYLVLEGFHLEYIDGDGFRTIIDTDIRIEIPQVDFYETAALPELFDFSIIADNSLETALNSEVVIDGNIYAGEAGITLTGLHTTIENADYVLTRGDITVGKPSLSGSQFTVGNASQTIVPGVWAKGIVLNKGTDTALYADTHVSDDLTLNGINTKIKLAESYYGWGNSTAQPELSSAIMINGIHNTIDMSQLNSLLLAGYAYISPAKLPEETEDISILMGESIAVKGDQIAYLIPEECIGVLNGETVVGMNPISQADYEEMQKLYVATGVAGFNEVSFDKMINAYGGTVSLSAYSNGEFKKVFVPVNGETMVYYYLVMSDTNANRFLNDYYGIESNKKKLEKYFNLYAKGGIHTGELTQIVTQGNYLTSVDSVAENGLLKQELTVNPAKRAETEALNLQVDNLEKVNAALTSKLVENYYKVSAQEMSKTVFENTIDVSVFQGFVGSSRHVFTEPGGLKAVLTGESEYVYDGTDPKIKLILAEHDVKIQADFEGIIIADGTVTIEGDSTVTSSKNAGLMSDMAVILQCPYSGVDNTRPIDMFIGGSNYVLAGTVISPEDKEVMNKIPIADSVVYQNWVKR